MKKLKLMPLWLSLGFTYILVIFYLCLRQVAPSEPLFPHFDKVAHSIAYLILGFWFALIYKKEKRFKIFILCTVQGIMIEYLQKLVGYRAFDLLDMVANAFGAYMGSYFLIQLCPDLLIRFEEFFSRD
jgi:VanZ family protein